MKPVGRWTCDFSLRCLRRRSVTIRHREARPEARNATIGLRAASELVIPLPPLAEQHRIVAKVDELMALCDRLEASLTTTDDTRRRLLDALLAEALAPAEERELEAAE